MLAAQAMMKTGHQLKTIVVCGRLSSRPFGERCSLRQPQADDISPFVVTPPGGISIYDCLLGLPSKIPLLEPSHCALVVGSSGCVGGQIKFRITLLPWVFVIIVGHS